MTKYRGITYPAVLDYDCARAIWKHLFCPIEWHLFDEVEASIDHYLICDACELIVEIEKINTEYMEKSDEES